MTDTPAPEAPARGRSGQRPAWVGELRPTQLLFSFGVGAVVDLPNISEMVMGLDDWDVLRSELVAEERLLAAVRRRLGRQVAHLYAPPRAEDGRPIKPQPGDQLVGVPVAPFPRWLVCSGCRLLSPLEQRIFQFAVDPYRPERTRFIHPGCSKFGRDPSAFPARFVFTCDKGHMDDFPWRHFVHGGPTNCRASLRLREIAPSGEAKDVLVECPSCEVRASMAQAFGEAAADKLPGCRGRRIHLRDFEAAGCSSQDVRTMLVGASNGWFPATLSVLSVPVSKDPVEQAVHEHWVGYLEKATSVDQLDLLLQLPPLRRLVRHSRDAVWQAIERRRNPAPEAGAPSPLDLKLPEWRVLCNPRAAQEGEVFQGWFQAVETNPPTGFETLVERVVLVERLREVRSLIGFTRIEAPDYYDGEGDEDSELAPLARHAPTWVPSHEVFGEGVFLQLREEALTSWLGQQAVGAQEAAFRAAHVNWNQARGVFPSLAGYPGLRFVLLHTLAHALMRQLSLECGYSAASVRERIYAREGNEGEEAMAGILLYTAAPDSEGTLGGLVRLGQPDELGRHLRAALDICGLCASDPLCAEHHPTHDGRTLHGAACHACLFAPETSCERGNRYLDRTVLVPTVDRVDVAFFRGAGA